MSGGATRRPTSFDVAERAGVSQSTVSRALAGSPVIAEPTRNKVLKAAEELGYFVDERAARLRRGSTGTLAVVVICRPGESASTINPFAYALLGSVCVAASERGFETLVSFQACEDRLFGHYQERGWADGLVVIGTTTNAPAWDYFRALDGEGRKVVYWGSPFDELEWVRSDNHAAGRLAVEHLAVDAGDIGHGDASAHEACAARLRCLGRKTHPLAVKALGAGIADVVAGGHQRRLGGVERGESDVEYAAGHVELLVAISTLRPVS